MKEMNDGMRIPDPIEVAEARGEDRLYEMTEGLPLGDFRCGCGRVGKLDGAQPFSGHPYAEPVCGVCFDAITEGIDKEATT